jgi:pyruvate kinase
VLTNTTAVGKYPLETVDIARRQFSEVEKALNYRKMYTDIRNHQLDFGKLSIADSIASSAVKVQDHPCIWRDA